MPTTKSEAGISFPSSRVDQFYIVQSGLKPGDRIVYEGIQNLKDGMTIEPKTLPARKPAALCTLRPANERSAPRSNVTE